METELNVHKNKTRKKPLPESMRPQKLVRSNALGQETDKKGNPKGATDDVTSDDEFDSKPPTEKLKL